MSIGKPRTLDEFGWTSGLSATNQRIAAQAALDSGDPIVLPADPVTIDSVPLDMNVTTSLTGNGKSEIRCADPSTPILRIRSEYSTVANFKLNGTNAARTAAALIVGPQNGDHARYVTIDRIWTLGTHGYGMHVKATGGLRIMGGMVNGTLAGIRWENIVANDTGDNKILGVDINAGNESGAGIKWTSGGGLLVGYCKFNQGAKHVDFNNSVGNTGTFDLRNNSFEGNTGISVDIVGGSWFNRMSIEGNNFGVLGCAVAVRNYATNGPAWPWLGGLNIVGNTIQAGQNGSNVLDIGCAQDPLIGPNQIQGNGTSAVGVYIRPECVGGKVNMSGSVVTGCAHPWANYGNGTVGV